MNVKKCVALLLSGMLFAGALSACDRTIIEHQFHTDTVTDTEYIEIGGAVIDDFGKLQSLFLMHGIDVSGFIQTACVDITQEIFDTIYAQYLEVPPESQIKTFETGGSEGIGFVIPCEGEEMNDFIFALSKGDKVICEQLEKYLDWDTFVQNASAKKNQVYIQGTRMKSDDGTCYAVLIVRNSYP